MGSVSGKGPRDFNRCIPPSEGRALVLKHLLGCKPKTHQTSRTCLETNTALGAVSKLQASGNQTKEQLLQKPSSGGTCRHSGTWPAVGGESQRVTQQTEPRGVCRALAHGDQPRRGPPRPSSPPPWLPLPRNQMPPSGRGRGQLASWELTYVRDPPSVIRGQRASREGAVLSTSYRGFQVLPWPDPQRGTCCHPGVLDGDMAPPSTLTPFRIRKLRSRKMRPLPKAPWLSVSELQFRSTEPLAQKQLISERAASLTLPTASAIPPPLCLLSPTCCPLTSGLSSCRVPSCPLPLPQAQS